MENHCPALIFYMTIMDPRQGLWGGSSPDYIKNPTFTVTDTNGQFAIPSLSFKKPLGLGRPKLNILAGYSPITHSAFVVKTSGNHQKITLQDNTTNLLAWEKDLNAFEGGYGQLVFDNELFKIKNGEEVEAMLKLERGLFNKTGFDSRDLLDRKTKNFVALDNRAHDKAYVGNWDGAIAEMTYVIEIRTNFFMDYFLRGSWKEKKGDLDGALADFDKSIELKPDGFTYFLRGKVKDEQGNWDGAIADFTKAIELYPNYWDSYISRGETKREKGDLSGALADYNTVTKLYKDRGNIYDLKKVGELNQRMQELIRTNGDSMSMTNSK